MADEDVTDQEDQSLETAKRDSLELMVYLSIVLIAALIGVEHALEEHAQVLLVWGTAIGLTLAHLFAFRLATVYERASAVFSDWGPIGAMLLTSVVVGFVATVPYVVPFDVAAPSTAAVWLLIVMVSVAGYLAALSRGRSLMIRLSYALVTVAAAAIIAVVKSLLTH